MGNDGGQAGPREVRAAVFVDFDNVYSGLSDLDPAAAEAFANKPATWLAGLRSGSDDAGRSGAGSWSRTAT